MHLPPRKMSEPASPTVTVFLTHQGPAQVSRMLEYWGRRQPGLRPLVAVGGSREDFEAIRGSGAPAVFVDDPRLRTTDHPRERQSYLGVFKCVAETLGADRYDFVHLVEYDEVPVVDDVQQGLARHMADEDADLLACGLRRVDGTNHPHYLSHSHDPAFTGYWRDISCRGEPGVVLTALGCGTFWRRAAFEGVASLEETVPCYLELFLPTAAHHLGYRARALKGQYRFMRPDNNYSAGDLARLAEAGALCAHPVKGMWLGGPDGVRVSGE